MAEPETTYPWFLRQVPRFVKMFKEAPIPFTAGALLLFGAAWFGVHTLYDARLEISRERLAQKDDQIEALRAALEGRGGLPPGLVGRRLSETQRETIAAELERLEWNPETVTVRYMMSCWECQTYATDLAEALARAGWRGEVDTTFDFDGALRGLHLVAEEGHAHEATPLGDALEKAGVPFERSTWEPPLITPVLLFAYPQGEQ
jgi:hypothetical protein